LAAVRKLVVRVLGNCPARLRGRYRWRR
jgi:hypothetical protein